MPGYYFITFCTKDRLKLLCDIEENATFVAPEIRLTAYGKVAEKQLQKMKDFYEDVRVEKYVIMPNHIDYL